MSIFILKNRIFSLQTFNIPDHDQHFFGLWPPINTSSIKITINGWNDEPCLSLLLLGCSVDNGKNLLLIHSYCIM